MSRLALLCFALLLAGCASPERRREANLPTGSARSAGAEGRPSRSLDETISLYYQAWDQYRAEDWREARRLAEAAFNALGPDTAENVEPQRILLIRELALFRYHELGLRQEGLKTWDRWKRACRIYEESGAPIEMVARLANSSLATVGPRQGPPDPVIFQEPAASIPEENARGDVIAANSESTNRNGTQPDTARSKETPAASGSGLASDRLLLAVLSLLRLGEHDKADELIDEGLRSYSERGLTDSEEANRLRELRGDMPRPGREDERSHRGDVPPEEEERAPRELPDERERPALRRMLNELSEDPSADPSVLGDLARFAGDLETARRSYESLEEDESHGPRRRLAGTMGRARLAGSGDSALALLERASVDARSELPANHPIVVEARDRYARAVREARGPASYCDLVETYLADELATLDEEHPIVQATRRQLASEYARQGMTLRAIQLQRQALGALEQTRAPGRPDVSKARLELVEYLGQAGEDEGARQILASTMPASSGSALRDLRAEALRLQRACQLAEALEVRRRITDRADEEDDPGARAEDLRDLAAVLRVLGQATDARGAEAEARLLERAGPQGRDGLAAAVAEASARIGRPDAPKVALHRSTVDAEGRCRITVDVEDPAGILALSLVQDGIPRSLPLFEAEWTLDESGTRAQVEILVSLDPGQDLSVVSVAAENTAHSVSAYEALVVERP